jgi:hypothetical protein
MMGDRLELEAEGQHVGDEARLDDLVEIDLVGLEMLATLLEEADDGLQRLEVVRYGGVVE